ncbi:MAG: DUF2806 domain-containing protein [Bifidobacterium scardovii]|jgi:hypothetical protein|uniref:DUF2806 domain-containing protein n=1 Tax=Bifidobacterium scardovii TaxID=158787 RepID=UPI002056E675|nr:DUF2806 domain-containing protein [Bifidobacterium scardovii]MDU2421312.1 DUF2806 domain-containing protein [Bifidobacterium scardovii]DAZ29416.1 MAG TPA: Protein of unknown function (DUF2806) [Caudoviricetes sp.]
MSDDDYGMIGKALAGVGAALEKTSESVDRLFPGIRRFWLRRADSKDYLQSIEDIRTALEDAGIPDDVIGRMVLTYTVNAKHLDNLAQVLDLTAGMIGDESDDTPQFPAPDWCDTFSETASRSYDDKARGMWARLLAGEINQPGSFSKRTLHTLDEISPFEAKLFERLCSWSIGIRTPEGPWLPVPLIATNPTETAAGMISWHDASPLEDAGLVTQSSAHGIIAHYEPDAGGPIMANGRELTITNHTDSPVELRFDYSFTKTGRELSRLCATGTAPADFTGLLESRLSS